MPAHINTDEHIESLVTMLLAACEDAGMNETLDRLLSQPDDNRRFVVQELVNRLRHNDAPQQLIEALLPLLDDAVAEKAYQAIYECRQKP